MLTRQRAPVVIQKFYVLTFSILFISTQDSAWVFYIIILLSTFVMYQFLFLVTSGCTVMDKLIKPYWFTVFYKKRKKFWFGDDLL